MGQEERQSQVVVVTGASAGVGRAIVREFAKHGASLGLLARSHDGLEGARREVKEAGCRSIAIPTDMADPQQVEEAADTITRELGPIDVWVNNAMVSVISPAVEMAPEDYQRVTNVSYLGYVYGTLAAVRRMRARNQGKIIQIGSALAYRSIPLQSAYCGAKHAIQGFTDSLRSELIHDRSNIDITTLQLPAVNTPQFSWIKCRMPRHPQPVPPIYQPEVIARAAYWAAHHRRRELWIGFSAVKAIVGQQLFPGFADHYLARMGYRSQQTDQPIDPHRPDNMYEPLPGDFGAHGAFDGQSRSYSLQSWLNMRRGWLSMAGLGAIAGYLWYRQSRNGDAATRPRSRSLKDTKGQSRRLQTAA